MVEFNGSGTINERQRHNERQSQIWEGAVAVAVAIDHGAVCGCSMSLLMPLLFG
jgi:hypothetical protein